MQAAAGNVKTESIAAMIKEADIFNPSIIEDEVKQKIVLAARQAVVDRTLSFHNSTNSSYPNSSVNYFKDKSGRVFQKRAVKNTASYPDQRVRNFQRPWSHRFPSSSPYARKQPPFYINQGYRFQAPRTPFANPQFVPNNQALVPFHQNLVPLNVNNQQSLNPSYQSGNPVPSSSSSFRGNFRGNQRASHRSHPYQPNRGKVTRSFQLPKGRNQQ